MLGLSFVDTSGDDDPRNSHGGWSRGDVCLVMELVFNGSLRSVLDKDPTGTLSLKLKLEILRGAANGLAYLRE
jgi:serine/threonine protein kinase